MKILVTGGSGMLGREICAGLSRRHLVVSPSSRELDVTRRDDCLAALEGQRPDLVVHCAAYTDVDGSEARPELAMAVNAQGTRHLVEGCAATGAALAYISTDYVFDGAKDGPYAETDPPNPQGAYALSKFEGERAVRAALDRHFLIRSSWLFGPTGRHFVNAILRQARATDTLRVVDDQRGAPTYTPDLAAAMIPLLESERYGTYHITNAGVCTWAEFAREILEEASIRDVRVIPITTGELNRPAPRPANSVLSNAKYLAAGFPPLRSYRAALAEYLATVPAGPGPGSGASRRISRS